MNRRDRGFTLVELLVSIAVLSIITVPLASAVMISLNTAPVEDRLSGSHSLQISSAYLSTDFASAHSAQPSQRGCAGTEGVLQLSLRVNDPATVSTSTSRAIDYVLAGGELVRLRCALNGTAERNVLASDVASVSFSCDATSPCIAGQRPLRFSVNVVGTPPSGGGAASQFSLQGTRRAP